MLNPKIGSKVYRFLKDVSSQYRYNPIIAIQELIAVDDVYLKYCSAPENFMSLQFVAPGLSWVLHQVYHFLLCNV